MLRQVGAVAEAAAAHRAAVRLLARVHAGLGQRRALGEARATVGAGVRPLARVRASVARTRHELPPKARPQSGHAYGFSPVCTRRCCA